SLYKNFVDLLISVVRVRRHTGATVFEERTGYRSIVVPSNARDYRVSTPPFLQRLLPCAFSDVRRQKLAGNGRVHLDSERLIRGPLDRARLNRGLDRLRLRHFYRLRGRGSHDRSPFAPKGPHNEKNETVRNYVTAVSESSPVPVDRKLA